MAATIHSVSGGGAKRTGSVRSFTMRSLAYFLRPFPSRQGFSAYRSPGLLAHVPCFLVFSVSGLLLCGVSPLLAVWMIAGLYLGRDVAILCHYAPILLLAVWAAMLVVLAEAKPLASFGHRHPAVVIALTVVLLLVQVSVAWRSARAMAYENGD